MTCDTCGGFVAANQGIRLLVCSNAWAKVADTIAYCSPDCEEEAKAGDWRPEWCEVCHRDIVYHDTTYDVRDARALQFTTDVSGRSVCRRCAGIPADGMISL